MAATGAFHDRCKIGTATSVTGYEPMPSSYTYGSEIRCTYRRIVGQGGHSNLEVMNGAEVAKSDVEIRVPSGTSVSAQSRIQLTKLRGAACSVYFAVVGEPVVLLDEILCRVQLITGGSAK